MLFLAYASFPSAGRLSSACGHRSPNYLFFFLQRQDWGSMHRSPWSADPRLSTSSLRFTTQLPLCCLLGSPLGQLSPGCLPDSSGAGWGLDITSFLLLPLAGGRSFVWR